jgi:hypothetical protein
MWQQLLAFIIIAGFLTRLFWQKNKKTISPKEFIFWSFFWFLAALAIFFIKKIDTFVARLGFGGQGIDVLFYLAVVLLFYLVFKLRIYIEKQDRIITKIIRKISLNEKE